MVRKSDGGTQTNLLSKNMFAVTPIVLTPSCPLLNLVQGTLPLFQSAEERVHVWRPGELGPAPQIVSQDLEKGATFRLLVLSDKVL